MTEQPHLSALPCPKGQWEARTEETWHEEMNAEIISLQTFGDLVQAKKHCDISCYAQQLDIWNAAADSLGTLMNISVAML